MLVLAVSCWLLGFVLARHLRIFALIPLMLVYCLVSATIGAANELTIQSILIACTTIVISLQTGFLVGALVAEPGLHRLPSISPSRRHLGGEQEVDRNTAFEPGSKR